MDVNTDGWPMDNKVFRKLIVQRSYQSNGTARIHTACFNNHRREFHVPWTGINAQPVRYLASEMYSLYVTALYMLYVPVATAAHVVAHTTIEKLWKQRQADGQWGHAVFTNYTRCLDTMYCFGGTWGKITNVGQVYPCRSYTDRQLNQETGIQQRFPHLCLGLFYARDPTQDTGRRRYVRGPIVHNGLPLPGGSADQRLGYRLVADQMIHTIGNVRDLLDFDIMAGEPHTVQDTHRFAIYLCAGARLVIIDDHNYNFPAGGHNRVLVQQGGVVVVEYALEWAPPGPLVEEQGGAGRFRPRSTADAIQYGFLTTTDENVRARVAGLVSPVLFLGATESPNETHCWGLDICLHDGRRRAFLSAPENGVVMRVEEYADGMAEIRARHQYEQLYGSVFTRQDPPYDVDHCCHGFEVPDNPDLLNKILGVNCDQWLGINYNVPQLYTTNLPPNPLRPAPYPYRPILCEDPHAVNPQNNRVRPPMPPLRPMAYCFTSQFDEFGQLVTVLGHRFVPNETDPDAHWRHEGQHMYRYANGNLWEKYSLSNNVVAMVQFEWNKVSDYYNPPILDGVTTRLGADGWAYEKGAGIVGTFHYPFYQRTDHFLYPL